MTTTTTGAHAARGEAMQTQVEWVESGRNGRKVHEHAGVGGALASTIRTYADDNSVTFFWIATARDPDSSVEVMDCGHVASLDEARVKAVERATWAAAALARVMGPDLAGAIRQAQASVDEARAAYDQGEWAEPETVACSALGQLAALVGGAS